MTHKGGNAALGELSGLGHRSETHDALLGCRVGYAATNLLPLPVAAHFCFRLLKKSRRTADMEHRGPVFLLFAQKAVLAHNNAGAQGNGR